MNEDEAFVKAAVPDARFSYAAGHRWERGIFSNDRQLATGNGWLYLGKKKDAKIRSSVWSKARAAIEQELAGAETKEDGNETLPR